VVNHGVRVSIMYQMLPETIDILGGNPTHISAQAVRNSRLGLGRQLTQLVKAPHTCRGERAGHEELKQGRCRGPDDRRELTREIFIDAKQASQLLSTGKPRPRAVLGELSQRPQQEQVPLGRGTVPRKLGCMEVPGGTRIAACVGPDDHEHIGHFKLRQRMHAVMAIQNRKICGNDQRLDLSVNGQTRPQRFYMVPVH